jgi:hypothetical protein
LIPELGFELGFRDNDDITASARVLQLFKREQHIQRFTLLRVFEVVADERIEVGGGERNDTSFISGKPDGLQYWERRFAGNNFAETGQSLFQICGGECDLIHVIFLWLKDESRPHHKRM